MEPLHVRDARLDDAGTIAEIYRPAVEEATTSFEERAPKAVEMGRRIREARERRFPWLVAERDACIVGYAYARAFRERHAYRFSVEVSVYVDPRWHRCGIGGTLYRTLFSRLHESGFRRAFAGISLPNEGSVALHRSLGFEPVGTYREAGFKFGKWIDVGWWQRGV